LSCIFEWGNEVFYAKEISVRHQVFSLILILSGLMVSAVSEAGNYELGQGWQSGHYHLSGYANIEVIDRFGIPSRIDMDDLSLFAACQVNQWVNPFTEVELSKQTLVQQGGGARDGDLIVERFYNDALFSEQNTLRVGKILTPLGDWNLVHAAPLIPIITRPYTTARGFDAYVSGIQWMHETGSNMLPELQFYWQPDNEWFKRPVNQINRNFHNVIGGHINIPMGLVDKIGASFQHGQLIETGETFTLVGGNVNQSFGKLRLESEAIMARFSGAVLPGTIRYHANESGIFVLADYMITSQWHGIVEGEHYQDHTVNIASRNTLAALAYRPNAAMVWKVEYIHQAGKSASLASISTGWKAAFSFLF
jgi:hypothetical protein